MKYIYVYVRLIDTCTNYLGKVCGWSLLAIGLFISFEIFMRYVLNSPTIWVDEMSRILQIWVVFLGASYVFKHGSMITITVFFKAPHTLQRRIVDTLSVMMLWLFMGVAVYYGFAMWLKATLAGHTTDTYLALPKWFTHAPVWIGGGLLMLQGVAQLVRIWVTDIPRNQTIT